MLLAASVVKAPVLLVEAPILVLLIVLADDGFIVKAPAGLIVTVPVPVGLNATLAFAGLAVNAPVNVPEVAVNTPPKLSVRI